MKKLLILLMVITTYFAAANISYSIETKSTDYEVIKETAANTIISNILENAEVIKEDANVKIIKSDGKYGIYDKRSANFIFKPVLDSLEPISSNENEYKVTVKNLKGYVNTDTKSNFLIKCDDIYVINEYVKVKNDGKFGLLDKKGNTILQPVYEQISIVNQDDNEYFSAKINGKNKMFYKTGKLIPDDELYTVTYDSPSLFAKDIRPEFINYWRANKTLYEKADYNDRYVYEIKEIKLPEKVKKTDAKKEETKIADEQNTLTINKKVFIITDKDNKIGLNTKKGKEILPPIYDSINLKKPCKHFSKEVILAKNGNLNTVYDFKGNVLAEQMNDKVNIYKNKKIYTYIKDGENWNLMYNKKKIGTLEITENGYEFTKTAFMLRNMHKMNELLLAILS